MASAKRIAANRRNATRSTGPKDTTQTRLNALTHGILTKEVLIAGEEDPEELANLADYVRADLSPEGVIEEHLVDRLVAIMWRERRLIRYETAKITKQLDSALHRQDRRDDPEGLLSSNPFMETKYLITPELEAAAKILETLLEAMDQPDKVAATPSDCLWVLMRAFQGPDVNVYNPIGIRALVMSSDKAPREVVRKFVASSCQRYNISEAKYWQVVKANLSEEYQEADFELKDRLHVLERERQEAALPDVSALASIQRYEAHLSRQWYQTLTELGRLQAARFRLQD